MFMYTCIHRVYMWEVEPTLYWRVKINGKWTWRPAIRTGWTTDGRGGFIVEPISFFTVEGSGDESE